MAPHHSILVSQFFWDTLNVLEIFIRQDMIFILVRKLWCLVLFSYLWPSFVCPRIVIVKSHTKQLVINTWSNLVWINPDILHYCNTQCTAVFYSDWSRQMGQMEPKKTLGTLKISGDDFSGVYGVLRGSNSIHDLISDIYRRQNALLRHCVNELLTTRGSPTR